MSPEEVSTPVNVIGREHINVLIRNNMLNQSVEFETDNEMDTESPVSKPNFSITNKRLFDSPNTDDTHNTRNSPREYHRRRKGLKRKQYLLPPSTEKINGVIKEVSDSPQIYGGPNKKILLSLFKNKDYTLEVDGST